MGTEQNKGLLERGAAALVGAAIFPPEAAALAVFGAWEIAHGALWNVIKNRASKKPKLAHAMQ